MAIQMKRDESDFQSCTVRTKVLYYQKPFQIFF